MSVEYFCLDINTRTPTSMGISDVQITIAVGWGLRGLLSLLMFVLYVVRGGHPKARILAILALLVGTTFVGSLAEYHDLALPYARLSEVAVGSFFVALVCAVLFSIEPTAAILGGAMLVGSNVLYAIAARSDDSDLELSLILLGGVAAVIAALQLRFSHASNWFMEWIAAGGLILFYFIVALQTIFGPYVLNEWGRLAWIIIWEVSITMLCWLLTAFAWFYFIPTVIDGRYGSGPFDALAYWITTDNWSVPPPKSAP